MWNLERVVQMDLRAGQEQRHRHRDGHVGTEGVERVYSDLYTPVCKQTARGKAVCNTGSSARCSVMAEGGGGGGGEGGPRGRGFVHTYS